MEKSTHSVEWKYPMNPSTARGMPLHLAVNSKSDRIGYPSQETAVLRSVQNPESFTGFEGHAKVVTALWCSPSNDKVMSGDETGRVVLWNADHPTLLVSWDLQGLPGAIRDGGFNQEADKACFVGDVAGAVCGKIVSVNMKKTDGDLKGHSMRALSCAFKPNRPYKILTGSEDNSMNLFSLPGWNLVKASKQHKGFVNCVRISPDGTHFVSVGADKSVQIGSVESGEIVKAIEGAHDGSVYSIAWFEDSARFATCSADKTVKIWSVDGNCLSVLSVSQSPTVEDMQLGVAKLKGFLVSVSLCGTINVWDEKSLGVKEVAKPDRQIFGHNVGVINE